MQGSAMTVTEGNKRLRELYGNSNAVFPENNGKVEIGTKVKVFPLDDGESWMDGKVVRGKRGKKVIRVTVNDRVQFIPISNCQFLVKW